MFFPYKKKNVQWKNKAMSLPSVTFKSYGYIYKPMLFSIKGEKKITVHQYVALFYTLTIYIHKRETILGVGFIKHKPN